MSNGITIGSLIKALDFPGNTTCYKVGVVTKIDGDFITADCVKDVWEGKLQTELVNERSWFTTTFEGNHFMDERFPGRITVLD